MVTLASVPAEPVEARRVKVVRMPISPSLDRVQVGPEPRQDDARARRTTATVTTGHGSFPSRVED